MRVSFTTRLSRAGVGLVAVWCLGCTSFDLVINALDGDTPRAGCAMAGASDAQVQTGESMLSSEASADSRGCGCGHCIAVQADPTEVVVVPHRTPNSAQHWRGPATSVDREPLVRPPIASIAI